MELSFVKLLNTSISAGWLILVVMVLRLVLKKAPKSIHCLLWALVAVRLMCPFSIESVFSLMPSAETVPEIYLTLEGETRQYGAVLEVVGNSLYPQQVRVPVGASVDRVQIQDLFWTVVWMIGMSILGLYALISYLRIRRKVAPCVSMGENVWLCDYIDTPFILGLISPRIYLPSGMEPGDMIHVLAHERAHLKRKDHWWKPLGFGLLTVYWFNPLIWVAYILLCRDIEMACDERVIRDLGPEGKKAYSNALLSCSVRGPLIAACPLAFGEVGVKERVKTVLNYRKPAFWVSVIAITICIVVAVCFLTDPKTEEALPTDSTEETSFTGETTVPVEPVGQEVSYTWEYGNISLMIPAGWQCEKREEYDGFGFAFRPEEAAEGWVRLQFYPGGFGVCGTGLEQEKVNLGAYTASAGYYDGSRDWSFLVFDGVPGSYVVTTENADDWWAEYEEQVMEILSTAKLGQGILQESEIVIIAQTALAETVDQERKVAVIWEEPSYMPCFHGDLGLWEVGLYFVQDSSPRAVVWIDTQGNVVEYENWKLHLFAENVSETGLTLVCEQYGAIPGDSLTPMELMTGAPFWLEAWNGSGWEAVPTIQEEVVWTTEGWVINRNNTTRWEVSWEYLYGELESGTYRIGKNVSKGNRPGEYAHQNYYAVFQIFDIYLGNATVIKEQESLQEQIQQVEEQIRQTP